MRADIVTKLSLYRWAQIMGIHPLHFAGVYVTNLVEPTGCVQPWLQHIWQDADRVGREDVAEAIAQAETDIERLLKFRLLPSWEIDEWRPTTRPYHTELFNLYATDIRGYRDAVRADWGHFVSGGTEKKDLIPRSSAIAWSDPDGDVLYEELGTVTVATTVTDPCEIAVYYPGKNGADEWEIRPINVSIAAGVATITFRREQAVLEALMESFAAEGVDGDNTKDANFLAAVDVYRHWNDPQTQVTLSWEPTGACSCGSTICPACAHTVQSGCLHSHGDPRLSILAYTPADWDAADESFCSTAMAVGRAPDVVRLYYYAGLRAKGLTCPTLQMDRGWERIVAYYAASLLERQVCDCPNVHAGVDRWRQDLAFSGGADELASYNLTEEDLGNPLGTRRGAIFAWKRIKQEAIGEAILA